MPQNKPSEDNSVSEINYLAPPKICSSNQPLTDVFDSTAVAEILPTRVTILTKRHSA